MIEPIWCVCLVYILGILSGITSILNEFAIISRVIFSVILLGSVLCFSDFFIFFNSIYFARNVFTIFSPFFHTAIISKISPHKSSKKYRPRWVLPLCLLGLLNKSSHFPRRGIFLNQVNCSGTRGYAENPLKIGIHKTLPKFSTRTCAAQLGEAFFWSAKNFSVLKKSTNFLNGGGKNREKIRSEKSAEKMGLRNVARMGIWGNVLGKGNMKSGGGGFKQCDILREGFQRCDILRKGFQQCDILRGRVEQLGGVCTPVKSWLQNSGAKKQIRILAPQDLNAAEDLPPFGGSLPTSDQNNAHNFQKNNGQTNSHNPQDGHDAQNCHNAQNIPHEKKIPSNNHLDTQDIQQNYLQKIDLQGLPPLKTPLAEAFPSVVKVFTDYTDPNFAQPWQMRRQMKSTGSGFVIEGRRIMTNAHCVAFNNRILVRKHGSSKKYLASVEAVAHEADLAVLRVSDEEFWEGVVGLEFGSVPALQDGITVVGYPTGGDNLSITAGVVSRVDVNVYAHSNFRLLCVQIDAATNPGNSGGPAFKDGKVVGVAFQGYDDAQNIGYIVPTPVIKHFLDDLEKNGKYTGFVTLGITYQPVENASLRKWLGIDQIPKQSLPPGITPQGILVVQKDSLRDNQFKLKNPNLTNVGLQKHDVILAIQGINVADDGTIQFRDHERVHLAHALADKFTGDVVSITVLRNKQVIQVTVSLTPPNLLVAEHQWDKKPRYYIYGGLVFCPMTLDYLKDEFGKKFFERAPSSLLKPMTDIFAKQEGEESIVLSQILAYDLTMGYDLRNVRLISVNGEEVINLKHLTEILESPKNVTERFVIFELEHELKLVLDKEQATASQEEILRSHAIPHYRSEHL